MLFSFGSETAVLSSGDLQEALFSVLASLGERRKVLAIPPDISRYHSGAGELTELIWQYYGERLGGVLPAIGTHRPMTAAEITTMFGATPPGLFRVHDWRTDLANLGEVPASFIREQSEGKLDFPWPAQVNKWLVDGGFDLILSIGQVVPHEVIGMASHAKNVLIGTGGAGGIGRSHYLGAVYGMERIMGRADTPVRRVLNCAAERFLRHLPLIHVLTVRGKDESGRLVTRGLFIGDDIECFTRAAELSLKVNFIMLDRPIRKAVVYLDPAEFRSTWIGNKAIYRTRMALADGADLIVLAPGVCEFGEDAEIDMLIRKYGYAGTPAVLNFVRDNADLAGNLGAAAHLIHGSSEGRFQITYCPGHLTRAEIESVNFRYASLPEMLEKYNPANLKDGYNTVDGEEILFVPNPALGLWAHQSRFGL
jgi:nickel-dependent lactate racemase